MCDCLRVEGEEQRTWMWIKLQGKKEYIVEVEGGNAGGGGGGGSIMVWEFQREFREG